MNLTDRANRIVRENPTYSSLLPVVVKELVHYDIFFHMVQSGLMPENMVFIGGTCLRLCHRSERFSEDLDFHAGSQFLPSDFDRLRESLEKFLNDEYGFPVIVKSPAQNANDPNYSNTAASTWKVIIETSPNQRHMPKQRVHIDIANIPTHEPEPDLLKVNYQGLPDGYDSIVVRRSSMNEILADKIIAVGARNNIKARDIWDIQWLRQNGINVDMDLVRLKLIDHGIKEFETLLIQKKESLVDYWSSGAFSQEMSRFLNSNSLSRTVQQLTYLSIVQRETDTLISRILNDLR
jgi:predicted nucleotidyltransferase component of viral defense system